MRRSASATALSLAVSLPVSLALSRLASAEPTRVDVDVEAGTELDTNPHRVDEAAEKPTDAAGVFRLGARFGFLVRPRDRHAFRLSVIGAAKQFTDHGDATEEDVAVLSSDARYDVKLADRPWIVGARASYYEAFERDTFDEMTDRSQDSDFRTADAAVSVTLVSEADHRITATGGWRLFQYKPNRLYDFAGEHAGVSYAHDFTLSAPDDEDVRSLDLTVQYSAQRRRYDIAAATNICPDYEDRADPEQCVLQTDMARSDLFHAGLVDLQYTGKRLYGARYELHLNDSTSFGESLIRHRLELSTTTGVVGNVYLTVKLLLQVSQFLDPALRAGDTGTFITIEDESRNALLLHATRELGPSWTLEGRYAFYSNEFSALDVSYRRQTFYLGVIYSFRNLEP